MIVDLHRFLAAEAPYWSELETMIEGLDRRVEHSLAVDEVKRLHYLYERASADLARLRQLPSEPRARVRLEALVARAYAEIHETRGRARGLAPLRWFLTTLPQTFRRHVRAFQLALAFTLVGACFGALVLYVDPEAKRVLLPYTHLG
ncbi:MAG TPA: stage II sporulation protein M, partial [Candidatus Hydrogenedentes bacterium]|nr:stage II sporulation protein M [Candidatus Hydrogenedentota bacterium]